MHCPHCNVDINDDRPECADCGFKIADLDAELGEPPERRGRVTDLAGALEADHVARLEERLAAFAQRTGAEMAVVVAPSTTPRLPAEYVFWLFNRWAMGADSAGGVLVLLALEERRIEVEVGVGLEAYVTDAESSALLEEHGVPFFAAGEHGEGLCQACDVLARVLENAGIEATS
jgi:uncharacterized protein